MNLEFVTLVTDQGRFWVNLNYHSHNTVNGKRGLICHICHTQDLKKRYQTENTRVYSLTAEMRDVPNVEIGRSFKEAESPTHPLSGSWDPYLGFENG